MRVGITRDDMILGMDFLRPVGMSFDITNGELTIGDEQVQLTSTELGGAMDVIIVRRVSIPAHSVGMVDCTLSHSKEPVVV